MIIKGKINKMSISTPRSATVSLVKHLYWIIIYKNNREEIFCVIGWICDLVLVYFLFPYISDHVLMSHMDDIFLTTICSDNAWPTARATPTSLNQINFDYLIHIINSLSHDSTHTSQPFHLHLNLISLLLHIYLLINLFLIGDYCFNYEY